MLIHNGIAMECARCLALGFVAPMNGDWSQQRPKTKQKTWPWVLLFGAMALAQVAMGVTHPELIANAYSLM
jgi:hypothetical protein